MKRFRFLIALMLLILPVAIRGLWFYRGVYQRIVPVPTPDYASLTLSVPPLATGETETLSAEAAGQVVLLDRAHKNQFDVTELEVLTRILTGQGARLETVQPDSPPLSNSLKYASAYIVAAPAAPFTPNDVQLVQRFVQRGGRLLVLADPTRSQGTDVVIANQLLAPFDLGFSDDYLYNMIENEGNYRNVIFTQFAAGPLTRGLSKVAFYGTCSVGTSTGTLLIQADEHTLSSRTDTSGRLAAGAVSANQQVLALGDLTFITPPYYQVADNMLLINRITEFLLSGKRTEDLANFPFLFKQSVAILPTKNITLSAQVLEALGKLQVPLKHVDIQLNVTKEPDQDSDLIVLGSYALSDDLMPYIKPIVPSLTETLTTTAPIGPSFSVPSLGRLDRSRTGLMLFSRTEKRASLVLLADNAEMLSNLIGVLASGDQSACVVQEKIALCSLGNKSKPE